MSCPTKKINKLEWQTGSGNHTNFKPNYRMRVWSRTFMVKVMISTMISTVSKLHKGPPIMSAIGITHIFMHVFTVVGGSRYWQTWRPPPLDAITFFDKLQWRSHGGGGTCPPNPNPARPWDSPRSEEKIFRGGGGGGAARRSCHSSHTV